VLVSGSLPVASALPPALEVGAPPVVGSSPELLAVDDVEVDDVDEVLAASDMPELLALAPATPPGSPQARSSTQEPMQTRSRIFAPYRARTRLGKRGPHDRAAPR
jgi:hypothetical protein